MRRLYLVLILCAGCSAVQQSQEKITMQEHEHTLRKEGETTVEVTIQQPAWMMAGKAAFASGRGADTQTQAQAAQNMAASQTNSKMADAGKEAIKAGTTAIAAFGTGIPGLGIATGGAAFSDLSKLLAGEQDLVKTHYYFQGPTPEVMLLGIGFDENENPDLRQFILSRHATVGMTWEQVLAAWLTQAGQAAKALPEKPAPVKRTMWERMTGAK